MQSEGRAALSGGAPGPTNASDVFTSLRPERIGLVGLRRGKEGLYESYESSRNHSEFPNASAFAQSDGANLHAAPGFVTIS